MNREKKPRNKMSLSELNPLNLWESLGLNQDGESVDNLTNEPFEDEGVVIPSNGCFENEDEKKAYEGFLEDFSITQTKGKENSEGDCEASMKISSGIQPQKVETPIISSQKGSLFIWALLKQEAERSKLFSVNHVFKDNIFKCMRDEGVSMNVEFDEMDFDEIASFLERKKLIRTARQAVRITQQFTKLFHESYGAWLVF